MKLGIFNYLHRQDGCTPWDAGKAQPPLKEILSNPFLYLPPNGRALVPGCGSVGFHNYQYIN